MTERWVIGFHDGNGQKRWWTRFTRPGFRHCFAMRYLTQIDAWALVEWSNFGMFVDFVPKRIIDNFIVGVNDCGGRFLEVEARTPSRRVVPPPLLYCVPVIKDLIGLRCWWVVTPWQLYCALRGKGARPMFELASTNEAGNGRSSRQKGKTPK